LKLTIGFAILLALVVVATAAIGYSPTQDRWGADGVDGMIAVAAICLGSALVALIPLAFVAPRYPDYIGQAALGATVIRLLLTMGALVAYQVLKQPHMASFLFWAPVFYLLLLAIETTFGVIMVKRHYRTMPTQTDGAAL
jgi:hypothetical protein